MIVDKHLADEIRRGKATVFRVPAKKGKAGAPYAKIGYEVAHDYPVRTGPGRDPVCTIRVASVDREFLLPTLAQARAAGFRTTDDYRAWWVGEWDYRVDGGLDEDAERTRRLGRFANRWHGTEVWVITFAVTTDRPRYLAAANRGEVMTVDRDDPGKAGAQVVTDYTSSPSRAADTLEAVDEATLKRYAKSARETSLRVRQSFQVDLEAERARRKAQRRPWADVA